MRGQAGHKCRPPGSADARHVGRDRAQGLLPDRLGYLEKDKRRESIQRLGDVDVHDVSEVACPDPGKCAEPTSQ